MAISFVGSAENNAINGADVTLTLPAMKQDDLVIVAYAIGDNDDLDFVMAMVTAGYTKVADLFANDVQDTHLGVFWKKMGATPDADATVDGQGGADAAVAAVAMVFRGVDTTTPMDVTPTTATAINTMHPNPPSIDPVTAGFWTVIAGASGHILTGTGTYTFPTGYTVDALDRGANDTSDVTVGMGYRTNPADPEDPGVMTHSGTDSVDASWCAATLALRPASVAAIISPGAIASAEAFGTAKEILALPIVGGLASAEAFGTAREVLTLLGAGAIASGEAFGTAREILILFPSSLASGEAIGSHTVQSGAVIITPTGIVSEEAFGTHKQLFRVTLVGITSAEAFGVAKQLLALLGVAIPSGEAFGAHRQTFLVSGLTGIPSGEVFGVGALVFIIRPTGIPSGEFGSVAVDGGEPLPLGSMVPLWLSGRGRGRR